jgi:transposase InsO family protein
MAFLEHGTRRLHLTPATAHPTGQWAVQQAREFTTALADRGGQASFLLRDRDTKYTASFDAVFTAEDAEVLPSAPRAPNVNAHCERVIGTVRREALDHVLIMNASHATKILTEFADHYNRHRPHRSRNSYPPTPRSRHHQPSTSTTAECFAPAYSEARSTSTAIPLDQQR